MARLVTFLTDFGLEDSYVAEVKAVLLSAKTAPTIVDITHQIAPYNVQWGGFQLLRAHSFFPKGTIHLAVVDPGVGTTRRAVWVKTRDYHFVGPDNGLLFWAVRDCERREKKQAQVFEIAIPQAAGPTFHGRDVFAPFALSLLAGRPKKAKKGAPLSGKEFPRPRAEGNELHGEVLGADHYGNLVTNIPHSAGQAVSRLAGAKLRDYPNYLGIEEGRVGLIRGSHGFWEISRRAGSAATLLGVKPGDAVVISLL